MRVFEMVVLIVAIGGITTVVSKWLENRRGTIKEEFFGADMDWDELGMPVSVKRMEQLEARVAVLEKIVTDRSYDLKSEIDRL